MKPLRNTPRVLRALLITTGMALISASPAHAADPKPKAAPKAKAAAAPAPAPAAAPAPAPAPAAAPAAPAPAAAPAAPAAPPAKVDIRQVQIQVWISETTEQGLRDLGTNLKYTRIVSGKEQGGSVQQVNTNVFEPQNDFGRVTLPAPDKTLFPAPLRPDNLSNTEGLQAFGGFGLTAGLVRDGVGSLEATFRGLERKADLDLISKPEILVVNNGGAEIKAGGQVPYQDVKYNVYGVPQLNVTWQDVGVNMKLKPTILPNNLVQVAFEQLDVTDVTRIENLRGVDLPVFAKRSQTGVYLVPNGQTLVIGGLSSRVERRGEKRVPLLGRLPIVGMPFRSRTNESNITHLLVFVAPTVVDLRALSDDTFNALNFWRRRGGDWSNSERIEEEVQGLQIEP